MTHLIVAKIVNISSVPDEVAPAVEKMTSSLEELSALSENLAKQTEISSELVKIFKISDEEK